MKKTSIFICFVFTIFMSNKTNAQWVQTDGIYGGYAPALAASGNNIFAGTNSGFSLSHDNGTTWIQTANQGAQSIAINGNNIFAGTNSGVSLSHDNGTTWIQTALNSQWVISLAANGNNIFAGTWSSGVFLSTDNGTSWSQTTLNDKGIHSLAIQGNNIYAGTGDNSGGHGVYLSTDNGISWFQTSLNSAYVYSLAVSENYVFAGADWGGVFRSTDNGTSWTPTDLNNKVVYSLAVFGNNVFAGTMFDGVYLSTNNGTNWVQTSLNNKQVYSLMVSGNNVFAGTMYDGIYRSSNNGINWIQTALNNVGAFSFTKSDNIIFAGTNYHGVYLSTNNGMNWTQTALINQSIYSLAINGLNIFAGTNNNGVYLSTNNGTSWAQTSLNNKIVNALVVSGNIVFAGTTGNGVYISTNGGITWSQTILNNKDVRALTIIGSNIFAGSEGYGVYLSTNNGTTWSQTALNNQWVISLASIGSNIFAGTSSNGVYRSTNNGINWIQTALNNKDVTSLIVSGSTIFAGTQLDGVYLSNNYGESWIQKNQGFNILPEVSSLFVSTNYIFTGTWNNSVWRRNLTETIDKYVYVTAPSGGENYINGDVHNFTWNSYGVQNVSIELSTNNGSNWLSVISSYPAASGSYPWTVPNYNSTNCKVRISDASNPGIYDISNNTFTISTSYINNGLVAYYPFEGNANDYSGFNNNGVQIWGSTVFQNGFRGQSAKFGGYYNPGHIKVANSSSLQVTSGMSISLWFRLDNAGGMDGYGNYVPFMGGHCLFAKSHDRTGYFAKIMLDNQGNLSCGFYNNYFSSNNFNIGGTVSGYALGTWKHIAFVISMSQARYYIDGQLKNVVNINNPSFATANGQDLFFGKFSDSWYPFNGALDDVKFYNRVLTDSEVRKLYNPDPYVTLNFPNGGESWKTGDKKYITWNAGNVNQIKLELSTNNGTNWISPPITTQQASNSSYEWTIPNNINSTQCKVRISDYSNPNVFDISDNVFSITPQTQSNSDPVRFKVFDPSNTITKARIRLLNRLTVYSPLVIKDENSFVNFSILNIYDLLVQSGLQAGSDIFKLELLDNNEHLIGHMVFKYNHDDFYANKKFDAILYVDSIMTAGSVQREAYPGWVYYSSNDEKLVSMLIPPRSKLDLINYNKAPVLFVHGVSGFYPAWQDYLLNAVNADGYDCWQFYYPYDQNIIYSSIQLRKAIYNILKNGGPINTGNYPAGSKIGIVAHSMGGLVTRTYIQSSSYSNNINKFLMLGTPNHGAYSAYLHVSEPMIGTFGEIIGKDRKAPAYIDLSLGSDFLYSINSTFPKDLYSGAVRNKTYLVIAGTTDLIPVLFDEIYKQEDGVVAVSSANLLEHDIPLGTLDINHTDLTKYTPTEIITNFLNQGYDPFYESNPQYIDLIAPLKSFWYSYYATRKYEYTNNSFNLDMGIVCFSFNTVNFKKYLNVTPVNNNPDKYYFNLSNTNIYDFTNLNSSLSNTSYFPTTRSVVYPKQAGINFGNNGDKAFILRNKIYDGLKLRILYGTEKTFNYKKLQTKFYSFDLTSDDKTVLESKGSIFGIPDKASQKTFYNIMHFNIDSSLDSLMFYLSCQQGDTAFINNDFKLITPGNITIDSAYAAAHSEITFRKSSDYAFVSYFIRNPQYGTWTAQYNSNLTDAAIIVPILSSITTSVNFNDTAYIAGDTLKFTVPLPTPINYTTVQISATMDFSPKNTDSTINLGNVAISQLNDTTYIGKYISTRSGTYTANLIFSCVKSGETIERHTSGSASVISIAPPVLSYPPNDTTKIPVNLTLKWNPAKYASKYWLQVFPANDTIPFVDLKSIADTTYYLDSLQNYITYLWRIKSLNTADTSTWSELRSFATIISAPAIPILATPPDSSGGIVIPVTLSWMRTNNAEKFHLMVSTDTSFTNLIVNDSTLTDTVKTLSGLNNLTKFYWKVRALNDGGTSTYSSRWTFRTMGLPTAFNLIQPADTSVNQPLSQTFRWSKSYDQTGTNLKIKTKTEKIQVISKSDSKSKKINDLSISKEKGSSDNTYKSRYKEKYQTDNISNYWFELVRDTSTMSNLLCDSSLTDTTKLVYGLENLKVYYWRVKSKNEIGWGAFTAWSKFTTISPPDFSHSAVPASGSNSTTAFGATDLTFNANVSTPKYVTVAYYTVLPVSGELPAGILSVSQFYWIIQDSGIVFSNGFMKIPLSAIGGVTDPSKLVLMKRSYAGDSWINLGGIIQDGYLINTVPFTSFSEFAVGSQDAQPLQNSYISITVIPEGFYDVTNNRLNTRDTITALLRSTDPPYTLIDSARGVIDSLTFTAKFGFKQAPTGTYYIVIKHRNSIETWSKSGGIAFTRFAAMTYNFTSSVMQAYGDNMIQKGTIWCIYSGDVSNTMGQYGVQDGFIDGNDNVLIFTDAENFTGGWVVTDLNGDMFVDGNDDVICFNNAQNFIGAIKPPGAPGMKFTRSRTETPDKKKKSSVNKDKMDKE